MSTFKGIIALDIDGTLTLERHRLEEAVAQYLNHLIEEGWLLVFLTGRTFSFAWPLISVLKGGYLFVPQNGAALYQMPEEKLLNKRYLSVSVLAELDPLFRAQGVGLLIESGRDHADVCYYKPSDFTPEELEYLAFRAELSLARWEPVTSFESLPFKEFAVIKFFAPEALAHRLVALATQQLPLKGIVIRDPFRPGLYLAHLNAPNASKGHALSDIIAQHSAELPVIAAGDDYNDVEMLEKSSVKIVMQNAPLALHKLADILAPPASEQGIIQGLEQGIWKALSE